MSKTMNKNTINPPKKDGEVKQEIKFLDRDNAIENIRKSNPTKK